MPERAWQDLAIDFFTAKECATFLVAVDYYSRFLTVMEMNTTTSSKTIEVLERIFHHHTYPETIRTDNGPPFCSEEFLGYCNSKNIRVIHTIPNWPQMDGTDPYWNRDEEVRDKDMISKMHGKLYADRKRHARDNAISVGNKVFIRNYEI
uniref:Uncharacterized protein n=1 Tax=Anopheles stephensi TaxID=30069 RepID=A0A182YT24_ANOST